MRSIRDLMGEYDARGSDFEQGLKEAQKKAVSDIDQKRAASVEEVKQAGSQAAEVLKKAAAEEKRRLDQSAKDARRVGNDATLASRDFSEKLAADMACLHEVKRRTDLMERRAQLVLGAVVVASLLLIGWLWVQRTLIVAQTQAEIQELIAYRQLLMDDVKQLWNR